MTVKTNTLKLSLPAFNTVTWHDAVNNNFTILDAVIKTVTGFVSIIGVWANSTDYAVNDIVVDSTDSTMWICNTAHTSAASGTTFSEDRSDNPTYWAVYNYVVRVRGVWETAHAYIAGDLVTHSSSLYLCVVAHTSGTFATDLAAADWVYLADILGGIDGSTTYAPISHTHPESDITNLEDDLTTGVDARATAVANGIIDNALVIGPIILR